MKQNKKTERQSLEYYFSLKYPISIYPEDEGYTVNDSRFAWMHVSRRSLRRMYRQY